MGYNSIATTIEVDVAGRRDAFALGEDRIMIVALRGVEKMPGKKVRVGAITDGLRYRTGQRLRDRWLMADG